SSALLGNEHATPRCDDHVIDCCGQVFDDLAVETGLGNLDMTPAGHQSEWQRLRRVGQAWVGRARWDEGLRQLGYMPGRVRAVAPAYDELLRQIDHPPCLLLERHDRPPPGPDPQLNPRRVECRQ